MSVKKSCGTSDLGIGETNLCYFILLWLNWNCMVVVRTDTTVHESLTKVRVVGHQVSNWNRSICLKNIEKTISKPGQWFSQFWFLASNQFIYGGPKLKFGDFGPFWRFLANNLVAITSQTLIFSKMKDLGRCHPLAKTEFKIFKIWKFGGTLKLAIFAILDFTPIYVIFYCFD